KTTAATQRARPSAALSHRSDASAPLGPLLASGVIRASPSAAMPKESDVKDTIPPAKAPREDAPPPKKQRPPWVSVGLTLALLFGLFFWEAQAWKSASLPQVDYSQFYGWVDQGKVAKVTIEGHDVSGDLKAPEKVDGKDVKTFKTTLPDQDDKDLMPLLRQKQVDVKAVEERA